MQLVKNLTKLEVVIILNSFADQLFGIRIRDKQLDERA